MIHMIQNAKDQVLALTNTAYQTAAAQGKLPGDVQVRANVEIPKDPANGDYTTTFALAAAKAMKRSPREIAAVLAESMDLAGSYFDSVEIAGAGFLNFRLGRKWYADTLSAVESEGAAYGRSDTLKGRKIMVEFVSANPTGPMHMGNARGGVLGDTLASVLQAAGADVWREFYVNDAGNQIEKFASSLEVRYLQIILGEEAVPFPEDGYHGDDIKELARAFYEQYGEQYKDADVKSRHEALAKFGLERNIPKMKSDLQRYKIEYDQWFFESSLHDSGYVADTVDKLTALGWTYEKEGALWLATSRILEETYRKAGKSEKDIAKLDLKDDVLRRANGFYTYFAADIAYHRNKFEVRGFDKAISLSDLLDEVPVDAARWFFNAKPDTQMDFDLGLAVREDSENPIYYVEYAHARICSLLRTLEGEGYAVPAMAEVDISLLSGETEQALIKQSALFCEALRLAARDYDPSHINRYLVELAGCFHRFYTACRIKGEERSVLQARLKLADAARSVLKNGLALLGVDAPEKM